jgi:hypothetical protein
MKAGLQTINRKSQKPYCKRLKANSVIPSDFVLFFSKIRNSTSQNPFRKNLPLSPFFKGGSCRNALPYLEVTNLRYSAVQRASAHQKIALLEYL